VNTMEGMGFEPMKGSHGLEPFKRNRLIPMPHSSNDLLHKNK